MKKYFGDNEVILVHGTPDPYEILSWGFQYTGKTCWICSDDTKMYAYEWNAFVKCEGLEESDDDYNLDFILRRANNSGQIQNAFKRKPNDYTWVMEFHFPEEFKEYIDPDESCPNMKDYGAVEIDVDIINKWIEENKCKIIFHKFFFAVKCSLLYLSGVCNNKYASYGVDCLKSYERNALEAISRGEFNDDFYEDFISWPDEIESFEIDLNNYYLK